jgi:hypothetical protein
MSKAKQDGQNPPDVSLSKRVEGKWAKSRQLLCKWTEENKLQIEGGFRFKKVNTINQAKHIRPKIRTKLIKIKVDFSKPISQIHTSTDATESTHEVSLFDTPEIRAAAEKLDAVEREFLESKEYKSAERVLQQALESAYTEAERQQRYDILNALVDLGDIQESRLVLLQRVADTRRQLAEVCELKDFKVFAELAPAQIDTNDSNLSRVFSRLRESRGILSVEWKGKQLYPAIQIDPESLKIFDEIPSLIKDAHAKGYSDWDILEWLATEQFEEVAAVPGRPVDYKTPQELLEKLRALRPLEALPEEGFIPIELLHARQFGLFNRLRQQWLVS